MSPPRPNSSRQDAAADVCVALAGGVEIVAEIAGPLAEADELRVERVVQLARQHLLALGRHSRSRD